MILSPLSLVALLAVRRAAADCSGQQCTQNDSGESMLAARARVLVESRSVSEDAAGSFQLRTDNLKDTPVISKLLELQGTVERMINEGENANGSNRSVPNNSYAPNVQEKSAVEVVKDYLENVKNATVVGHKEDQGEIDDSITEVKWCNGNASIGMADADALEAAMNGFSSDHSECRKVQASLNGTKINHCEEFDAKRTGGLPDEWTTINKYFTKSGPSFGEMTLLKEAITDMKNWFLELENHTAGCPTESPNSTLNLRKKDCDGKQDVYERSTCDYQTKQNQVCGEYDTCYDTWEAFIQRRTAAVRDAEEHRKAEHVAATRVGCLIGALLDEKANKTDLVRKCKAAEIRTDHLNIRYDSIPDKHTCKKTGQDPDSTTCDAVWVADQYTSEDWSSKAPPQECTPCPTPAPTPAPTEVGEKAYKAVPHADISRMTEEQDQEVYTIFGSFDDVQAASVACDVARGGGRIVGAFPRPIAGSKHIQNVSVFEDRLTYCNKGEVSDCGGEVKYYTANNNYNIESATGFYHCESHGECGHVSKVTNANVLCAVPKVILEWEHAEYYTMFGDFKTHWDAIDLCKRGKPNGKLVIYYTKRVLDNRRNYHGSWTTPPECHGGNWNYCNQFTRYCTKTSSDIGRCKYYTYADKDHELYGLLQNCDSNGRCARRKKDVRDGYAFCAAPKVLFEHEGYNFYFLKTTSGYYPSQRGLCASSFPGGKFVSNKPLSNGGVEQPRASADKIITFKNGMSGCTDGEFARCSVPDFCDQNMCEWWTSESDYFNERGSEWEGSNFGCFKEKCESVIWHKTYHAHLANPGMLCAAPKAGTPEAKWLDEDTDTQAVLKFRSDDGAPEGWKWVKKAELDNSCPSWSAETWTGGSSRNHAGWSWKGNGGLYTGHPQTQAQAYSLTGDLDWTYPGRYGGIYRPTQMFFHFCEPTNVQKFIDVGQIVTAGPRDNQIHYMKDGQWVEAPNLGYRTDGLAMSRDSSTGMGCFWINENISTTIKSKDWRVTFRAYNYPPNNMYGHFCNGMQLTITK